jgi:Methyltransferase domain
VAMLVGRLVGSSGEVVGVERDSRSIARARVRVAEAGLHHVRFTQCDVSQVRSAKPFDVAVGRFILQFVSDPVAVRVVCLSWFVQAELLPFTRFLTPLFLRFPPTCLSGLRRLLYSMRLCNALAPIQK